MYRIAVFCFALFNISCGAMFNGTTQEILTQTSPTEVQVVVDGANVPYTTPTTLILERKDNYVLTFSKQGYAEKKVEIKRTLNGGILVLDILTGGIGVLVDAVTGAWYNLTPTTVAVSLVTLGEIDGPETIEVAVRQDEDQLVIDSSTKGVTVRVERAD